MSHADELSPSACPASPWPAAAEVGQPVRPEERAVSIPATRTPPDDHPDSYILPAPVSWPGEAGPSVADRPVSDPPAADRSDHDPLAAGWTGTERAALTGRVEHEYHALPTSIADAPPAPDRRQLHLYAGATVVGVLLSDGQLADAVDARAAAPPQVALAHAEERLAALLCAHEHTSPAHVAAQAARLRHGLDSLARGASLRASDARRLRIIAGRITVLHADAAFKLGTADAARALAAQGYADGLWAQDGPLQGSAREIAAVIEFYDGCPDRALQLARDGLRHVGGGPVQARLVCQEARALAALGDVRAAAQALDTAYDLADMIPVEQWGSPGPGFDTFHPVEVAYNATTALCLLRRPRAAEEHAQIAIPRLDMMNAPGFRSVIRLDLALALVQQGRLELDRVCALATEAVRISWGRTVASASNRADELLAITRTHGDVRDVRELAAFVREWQREGGTSRGTSRTAS
ncbi:hypothetical protein [Frankia sp. CiP3]|uniref:hypothetical protein n=1 Tax=Frankia sp. CiP3 TaxID=2880971 RepID=UPI001EF6C66C|nr:hypothetical protein [Frankia sp. CiP3]